MFVCGGVGGEGGGWGGAVWAELRGHVVELRAPLHYLADLVMTAGAQEEHSGGG